MIRSMTGFARSETTGEQGSLTWELRSVNHRYLEIGLRLPEPLRDLEGAVRERIQQRLGRGKLDASLRYAAPATANAELALDEDRAKAVIHACALLEGWMSNAARTQAIEVLAWPGVVREAERDLTAVREQALGLLDQALEQMIEARGREGAHLRDLLLARAEGITVLVERIRERRPQVVQGLREKLLARIAELKVDVDAGRLEQEIAIQAQRLDVAEELDRLDGHVKELAATLDRDEPIGRRLDFLMQEFNREANTLSSKSNDLDTTRAAVELKVLIEQMREQVQNLE
ncbi:MAG: YicC/YloC family endoribonuclease [Ectothiorhodospiraceae bacterium]|jgi:uncharacterized protein (TIGR00255 family)|nr:YicC/YloC family endoribonuclease [Ectothiorhodospiraceae bacterium]